MVPPRAASIDPLAMSRFVLAFLCFYRILFGKRLPSDALRFLPEGAEPPKQLPSWKIIAQHVASGHHLERRSQHAQVGGEQPRAGRELSLAEPRRKRTHAFARHDLEVHDTAGAWPAHEAPPK